jgi:SAM-dependent methyltransferase
MSYKNISEYYKQRFEDFGDTPEGLSWPNYKDMLLRYKIMSEVIRGDAPATLLDLGCGTGHFLEFLETSRPNAEYTGADINKDVIELCKRKYKNVKFDQMDVLANPDKLKTYDYIVMNGIFTVKDCLPFESMFDFLTSMLKIVFKKANKGIAFNVMSKQVDWERDDLFHLPHDILASFLCKSLSRNYIIRNDYGLYEYTVYVYKEG